MSARLAAPYLEIVRAPPSTVAFLHWCQYSALHTAPTKDFYQIDLECQLRNIDSLSLPAHLQLYVAVSLAFVPHSRSLQPLPHPYALRSSSDEVRLTSKLALRQLSLNTPTQRAAAVAADASNTLLYKVERANLTCCVHDLFIVECTADQLEEYYEDMAVQSALLRQQPTTAAPLSAFNAEQQLMAHRPLSSDSAIVDVDACGNHTAPGELLPPPSPSPSPSLLVDVGQLGELKRHARKCARVNADDLDVCCLKLQVIAFDLLSNRADRHLTESLYSAPIYNSLEKYAALDAQQKQQHRQQMSSSSLSSTSAAAAAFTAGPGAPRPASVRSIYTNTSLDNRHNMRIIRSSRLSGTVSGGEEMFLFCSYFDPADLEVEFVQFHAHTADLVWRCSAPFDRTDIHGNCALVVTTPRYATAAATATAAVATNLCARIKVYYRLFRPSTKEYSDKWVFYYHQETARELKELFGAELLAERRLAAHQLGLARGDVQSTATSDVKSESESASMSTTTTTTTQTSSSLPLLSAVDASAAVSSAPVADRPQTTPKTTAMSGLKRKKSKAIGRSSGKWTNGESGVALPTDILASSLVNTRMNKVAKISTSPLKSHTLPTQMCANDVNSNRAAAAAAAAAIEQQNSATSSQAETSDSEDERDTEHSVKPTNANDEQHNLMLEHERILDVCLGLDSSLSDTSELSPRSAAPTTTTTAAATGDAGRSNSTLSALSEHSSDSNQSITSTITSETRNLHLNESTAAGLRATAHEGVGAAMKRKIRASRRQKDAASNTTTRCNTAATVATTRDASSQTTSESPASASASETSSSALDREQLLSGDNSLDARFSVSDEQMSCANALERTLRANLDSCIGKMNSLAARTGKSLLHLGRTSSYLELLKTQRFLINVTDDEGNTPIHLCVMHGHRDVLRLLVDVALTVPFQNLLTARNAKQLTPLLAACHLGDVAACQMLLDASGGGSSAYASDLTLLDAAGCNPVHIAVRTRNLELLRVLVRHLERAPVGQQHGVLNGLDQDGYAPIHLAVLSDCAELLRELLYAKSVRVSSADKRAGYTALHHAAAKRTRLDACKLLVGVEGVQLEARAHNGCTPLLVAVANKNYLITCLLLASGASLSARSDAPMHCGGDGVDADASAAVYTLAARKHTLLRKCVEEALRCAANTSAPTSGGPSLSPGATSETIAATAADNANAAATATTTAAATASPTRGATAAAAVGSVLMGALIDEKLSQEVKRSYDAAEMYLVSTVWCQSEIKAKRFAWTEAHNYTVLTYAHDDPWMLEIFKNTRSIKRELLQRIIYFEEHHQRYGEVSAADEHAGSRDADAANLARLTKGTVLETDSNSGGGALKLSTQATDDKNCPIELY